MRKEEMRQVLSERLATFRTWNYERFAERVKRDRENHGCLDCVEGTAPDGTRYQMEFQVFWDDKPGGSVRVLGDLSVDPSKPWLGLIPIFVSDVTDSFIMSPGGRVIEENKNQ